MHGRRLGLTCFEDHLTAPTHLNQKQASSRDYRVSRLEPHVRSRRMKAVLQKGAVKTNGFMYGLPEHTPRAQRISIMGRACLPHTCFCTGCAMALLLAFQRVCE